MPSKLNPFLANNHYDSESELLNNLIVEAIQQKGVAVWYIIRDKINNDYLFGESSISDFKEYTEIEMYLKNVDAFDGNSDIYSQFGFEPVTSVDLEVAISRFKEELLEYDIVRPREGDLIYLPFSKQLLEVKKVNNDDNYFQLKRNYRYVIKTQIFNYSHEALPDTLEGLDSSELSKSLGLFENNFDSENTMLIDEGVDYQVFNPDNPFN